MSATVTTTTTAGAEGQADGGGTPRLALGQPYLRGNGAQEGPPPSETLPHDPQLDRIVGRALYFAIATACIFLVVAALAALIVGLETSGLFPPVGAEPPDPLVGARGGQPPRPGLLSVLGVRAGWAMTNLVRGAEVFATVIAALLVFLVIRARPTDALMSLLGLIVIAALIVPITELTRIADSLRGNEREQAEPPRAATQSVGMDPETSQVVARLVLSDLVQNQFIAPDGTLRREVTQLALTEAMGLALYRVEVGNIATTVRQRGHARLLLELTAQESRQNLFLSPAMNRAVREDVKVLTDLGVVSIVYGNLAQVQPTALGIRVLHRLFPDEARVHQVARENNVPLFTPSGALATQLEQLRNQRDSLGRIVGSHLLHPDPRAAYDQDHDVASAGGILLRVRIDQPMAEVTIEARGRNRFDPTLTLYRATAGQGAAPERITSIDDWGGSNDARLLRQLAAGDYLVQVTGFGGSSGRVRLVVRTAAEADRIATAWPEDVPSNTPALREVRVGEWSEELAIGADTGMHRRVVLSTPGRYRLTASVESAGTDPYLVLLREMDGIWQVVDRDDDSGGNLASLLDLDLVAGTYAVRLSNLSAATGRSRLTIQRQDVANPAQVDPRPRAAAAPPTAARPQGERR